MERPDYYPDVLRHYLRERMKYDPAYYIEKRLQNDSTNEQREACRLLVKFKRLIILSESRRRKVDLSWRAA
jgi:hypothetical protein